MVQIATSTPRFCRISAHKQPLHSCILRQKSISVTPREAVTNEALHGGQPTTSAEKARAAAAVAAASVLLQCPQAAWALPEQQLESIQQQIVQDFVARQYYVTGNLTTSLYAPSCEFRDPTTDVKGVQPYTRAVAALFDPAVSRADLISSSVSSSNSITLRWRLEGRLKIGNLAIKPYTGTTTYTVDEDSGLIMHHNETWDISALDAFVSTLFPGFGRRRHHRLSDWM